MKELWGKFTKNTRRRALALMLALLLIVNVLAVALPGRGFENARADEAKEYKSIAILETAPSSSSSAVGTDPVYHLSVSVDVDDGSRCYLKSPTGENIECAAPVTAQGSSKKTYTFDLGSTYAGSYIVMAEDGAPASSLTAKGDALNKANVHGANLTSVVLKDSPDLSEIAVDETKATKIESFDCSNCALDFADLSLIKSKLPAAATLTADPQADIDLPTHAKSGTVLDVSPYCSSNTTVQWYDAENNSPISAEKQHTLGNSPDRVYAVLTDDAFPDVTIKTNTCSLISDDTLFYYHTEQTPNIEIRYTSGSKSTPKITPAGGYAIVRASNLAEDKEPNTMKQIVIINSDVTDFQLLADAADYPYLTSLSIEDGDLGTVDLSKSAVTNELELFDCGIRKIYLSDATYTKDLELDNSPAPVIINGVVDRTAATPVKHYITNLSVCNCGYTGEFDATEYCVTNTLSASDNELTSVKLTDTLTGIDLHNNKLTELEIPAAANIKNLDISGNKFAFAALPDASKVSGVYTYAPQSVYEVTPENYAGDDKVDLSGAGATGYTWYKYDETKPDGVGDELAAQPTGTDGKFTGLPDGEKVICKMTSTRFPGLTILTTPVTYSAAAPAVPELKATVAYNAGTGKLKAEVDDGDIYIDWGDGEPKKAEPDANGVISGTITENENSTGAENKYLIHVYSTGNLTKLDVKDSNVVGINVEKCTELKELDCSNSAPVTSETAGANTISVLDVSKNTNLEKLNCENNQIVNSGLKLPENGGKITDLDCSGNKLTYNALPAQIAKIKDKSGATLDCSAQKKIDSVNALNVGEKIDLTSQATYAETPTVFEWYAVDGTNETKLTEGMTETADKKGEFTVGSAVAGKTLVCKMSNPKAPNLIETVPIKINALASNKKAAEITVDKGTDLEIKVKSDKPVYIDFGTGVSAAPVTKGDGSEETITGTAAGTSVKLYTDGDMTYLKVNNSKVSKVDVSPSTKLTELNVANCSIPALDTSKNTELKTLVCSGNKLTDLNTAANTKLENLDCSKNGLKKLTIPESSLKTLDCSENALDYTTLPESASKLGANLKSQPQELYSTGIPAAKAAGKELDLSAQKEYAGTNTVYTWYRSDDTSNTPLVKGTDYTESNGKFTFKDTLKDKSVYAVMTNAKAPDLKLKTVDIKITDGGEWFINDGAKVLATNTPVVATKDASCKDSASGNLIPISDLELKSAKSDNTKLQFVTSKITDTAKAKEMLQQIKSKNTAFKDSYNQYALYDLSLKCADGTSAVKDLIGAIDVRFKLPDSVTSSDDMTYYVYHHDPVKGIEMVYTGKGAADGIAFTATSFSPYSLVWLNPRQINEGGNSSSNPSSNPSSSNPSSNSSSNPSSNTSSNSSAPGTGDNNSSTNNGPKTGDNAKASSAAWAILFISLLILSALGVSGVVIYRKRKIVEESLNRER